MAKPRSKGLFEILKELQALKEANKKKKQRRDKIKGFDEESRAIEKFKKKGDPLVVTPYQLYMNRRKKSGTT